MTDKPDNKGLHFSLSLGEGRGEASTTFEKIKSHTLDIIKITGLLIASYALTFIVVAAIRIWWLVVKSAWTFFNL